MLYVNKRKSFSQEKKIQPQDYIVKISLHKKLIALD